MIDYNYSVSAIHFAHSRNRVTEPIHLLTKQHHLPIMTPIRHYLKKLIATVVLLTVAWFLLTHSPEINDPLTAALQGYIEGEFLYLAAPLGGTLQTLSVQRGHWVKTNDSLFALDSEPEATAVREAEARLRAAQARLSDLQKGQRPTEIKALEARQAKANTDLELAKLEQARYEKLYRQKMIQEEALDTARANTQRSESALQDSMAQLQTAKLPAREDIIAAATAEVANAQATLEKAQWWVTQKQISAPQAGQIVDTFYYAGEWVPANTPVVSLLPPERVKVRFFVPEKLLGRLKVGQRVHLKCDSCDENLGATINYISPQAEYTPPVVYSRENRAKLVYLVEATSPGKEVVNLHPGQPVEVELP
jgi:HlyD family secretion protein